MNGGSFTLPSGRKVRTQSRRRFVVFYDNPARERAGIEYRTDVRERAIQRARATMFAVVVDTVTGQTLYSH